MVVRTARRRSGPAGRAAAFSDRLPEAYIPELEGRQPGVISSHWIPMDPELWKVERMRSCTAGRRRRRSRHGRAGCGARCRLARRPPARPLRAGGRPLERGVAGRGRVGSVRLPVLHIGRGLHGVCPRGGSRRRRRSSEARLQGCRPGLCETGGAIGVVLPLAALAPDIDTRRPSPIAMEVVDRLAPAAAAAYLKAGDDAGGHRAELLAGPVHRRVIVRTESGLSPIAPPVSRPLMSIRNVRPRWAAVSRRLTAVVVVAYVPHASSF